MKFMRERILAVKKLLEESQKGFSLVEILVALTLLGIAGTFVAGKIFEQLHEGKVKTAKIQMGQFEQLLKEYKRKCGTYPTTEQGLDSLTSKPTSGRECRNYPTDGFIESGELPLDPWDNDYVFESDGRKFNILSYGNDLMEGGEGEDADISFRKRKGNQDNEDG